MEVVLASGQLMRRGMGAVPHPLWQGFKYGFGPHVSLLCGQSNFGIVTKRSFWLLPEQKEVRSFVISVRRNHDVERFLDIVSFIVHLGTVNSSWHVTSMKCANDPDIRAPCKQARVIKNSSASTLQKTSATGALAFDSMANRGKRRAIGHGVQAHE